MKKVVVRRCFSKLMFLKISKYSQKKSQEKCWSLLLATSLKKRLRHRFFPVNIAKFLKNTSGGCFAIEIDSIIIIIAIIIIILIITIIIAVVLVDISITTSLVLIIVFSVIKNLIMIVITISIIIFAFSDFVVPFFDCFLFSTYPFLLLLPIFVFFSFLFCFVLLFFLFCFVLFCLFFLLLIKQLLFSHQWLWLVNCFDCVFFLCFFFICLVVG